MQEHTAEPWETSRNATPEWAPEFTVYGADSNERTAIVFGEDNARRIVACVNALAGVPTEALSSYFDVTKRLIRALAPFADLKGGASYQESSISHD